MSDVWYLVLNPTLNGRAAEDWSFVLLPFVVDRLDGGALGGGVGVELLAGAYVRASTWTGAPGPDLSPRAQYSPTLSAGSSSKTCVRLGGWRSRVREIRGHHRRLHPEPSYTRLAVPTPPQQKHLFRQASPPPLPPPPPPPAPPTTGSQGQLTPFTPHSLAPFDFHGS